MEVLAEILAAYPFVFFSFEEESKHTTPEIISLDQFKLSAFLSRRIKYIPLNGKLISKYVSVKLNG